MDPIENLDLKDQPTKQLEKNEKQIKPERVCIKVSHLRKIGYNSLDEWMKNSNNVYCGRHGRIFIHENGGKRIFHFSKSEYANPFTVKKYGLEKCLELYEDYLNKTPLLIEKLKELKGKNLGCWCNPGNLCHVDILIRHIK